MMAIGIAGWWYNSHLATTQGHFYLKLCLIAPLGVFGGLLALLRPEYAGPWRPDSPRAHKASLIAVIVAMTAFSGIEMYRLKHVRPASRVALAKPAPRIPAMPAYTPAMAVKPQADPNITILGETFRLASHNQRNHPIWEFVRTGETVDNWTRLLTIVDRTDAHSREDLDRLAEGLVSTYRANGGKILLARTMRDNSGAPYNYLVAAFEQPGQKRLELNFVKVALGQHNAVVTIYGARIQDAAGHTQAKAFLDQNSTPIGQALNSLHPPDIAALPRRVF